MLAGTAMVAKASALIDMWRMRLSEGCVHETLLSYMVRSLTTFVWAAATGTREGEGQRGSGVWGHVTCPALHTLYPKEI